MAVASVYLSCRQCGIPRTLKEITKASNSSKKEISRCYRLLFNEFDCKIPIQKPGQYVPKLSNKMTYQGKAEEIANKLIAGAKQLKLTSGRDPTSIAAAATYISSILTSERITQRNISELAKTTEVTVRNRSKELMRRLDITTTH
jgi:transcription initiation factor TFIIB